MAAGGLEHGGEVIVVESGLYLDEAAAIGSGDLVDELEAGLGDAVIEERGGDGFGGAERVGRILGEHLRLERPVLHWRPGGDLTRPYVDLVERSRGAPDPLGEFGG